MILIKFLFSFYFIAVTQYLISQNLTEIFNKKLSIDKNKIDAKEFFDILSKEAGIDFIFSSKIPVKISVIEYKNKPLKLLLKHFQEQPGFKFILKFENDNPYILVEPSEKLLNFESNSDLIDINLENALVKDFFSTMEEFSNKKFVIKNEEILSKKITLKCKKKLEDILNDASKILNFNYKIEGNNVVIE